MKSRKIRVYPNPEQRNAFQFWIRTSRFVYNRTIEYLQRPGTQANWKAIKGEILAALPEWTDPAPYQIKSVAVRDACIAAREAKRKTRTGIGANRAGFRSRKNPYQSCYIPKSAVRSGGVYPTYTGELRWSEAVPDEFGDCRLVWHDGRWYVCMPTTQSRCVAENQGRVVSLDPGVRTFLTWFSERDCGKIGRHDIGRIQRLCAHLDDLLSRASKAPANQRRSMHRAAGRMRQKIRDLVDELHHKTARFLVDQFDVILLPTFEVGGMSTRLGRKINRKSVRGMLNFAHFRFKQFLKHKAFETGKIVIDVNEAYTSKTVSWTGEIVANLGGRRTIKSRQAGESMDRDYNGARGILLRALRDTATQLGANAVSNC